MSSSTQRPVWFKYAITGGIFLIFLIATISALDLFDDKPYDIVPHGNHSHYVPKDRDPDVPLHNFPQEPPPPGMKIAPDGSLVRE